MAVRQNSLPITEARSITARSSRASRSRRAASRAWIVGGIARSAEVVPFSVSMASICSTKSGFPSAARVIRESNSSPTSVSPRRCSRSSSACSSESGSSVIASPRAIQAGWRSSSSGRARQTMSIGASRDQPQRYSIRSTKVDSAHWRSSKLTIKGCSRARCSSRRRTAHIVSSGEADISRRPIAPAICAAIRSASGSPSISFSIASCESSRAASADEVLSGQ